MCIYIYTYIYVYGFTDLNDMYGQNPWLSCRMSTYLSNGPFKTWSNVFQFVDGSAFSRLSKVASFTKYQNHPKIPKSSQKHPKSIPKSTSYSVWTSPKPSDFPPGLAAKISVHLPKLLPTSTTSSVAVTTWRAKRLTDVIPYHDLPCSVPELGVVCPKKMIYIKKSVISPLNQ